MSESDESRNTSGNLERHVLVLNSKWRCIGTITVRDAIVVLCKGSAKALCVESSRQYSWEEWVSDKDNPPNVHSYIRTPTSEIPAPEVIILNSFDAVYRRRAKFSNRNVHRRDDYMCAYCGADMSSTKRQLSVDHIFPTSRGGERASYLNTITACKHCNVKKSDKTPDEAGMKLLWKPTIPAWNPLANVRKEFRHESWRNFTQSDWWD